MGRMTDPPQPEYLRPRARLDGPVVLAEPDPAWPEVFAGERAAILGALGPRALGVEHVGSTSVPGLAAKPVVDIVLVVADPADEPGYVPDLEASGYLLHLREPGWHQHRLLRRASPAVNLHVFGPGSDEVARMLRFRDRLRTRPDELARYQRTKRELAAGHWGHMQDYADAKSAVVEEIIARAAADPDR